MNSDIKYLKLFPKRYKTSQGKSREYWSEIAKRYDDFRKRVDNSDYHWYVITFKDGRKELAYFKVRRLQISQGRLCRGLILPRYWEMSRYEHVADIRLAF